MTPFKQAMLAVHNELCRQESLCRSGKFDRTLQDDMPAAEKLAVIAEEFGEVAEVVADSLQRRTEPDHEALKAELTQVAACCVAWLMSYADDPREDGLPVEAFSVNPGVA